MKVVLGSCLGQASQNVYMRKVVSLPGVTLPRVTLYIPRYPYISQWVQIYRNMSLYIPMCPYTSQVSQYIPLCPYISYISLGVHIARKNIAACQQDVFATGL